MHSWEGKKTKIISLTRTNLIQPEVPHGLAGWLVVIFSSDFISRSHIHMLSKIVTNKVKQFQINYSSFFQNSNIKWARHFPYQYLIFLAKVNFVIHLTCNLSYIKYVFNESDRKIHKNHLPCVFGCIMLLYKFCIFKYIFTVFKDTLYLIYSRCLSPYSSLRQISTCVFFLRILSKQVTDKNF